MKIKRYNLSPVEREAVIRKLSARTWLQYWDYQPLLRQNLLDILMP